MAKHTGITTFGRDHGWWIVWAPVLPSPNTSEATLDLVKMFDQPAGGRRVGVVRSGTRVTLIRRDGTTALIRTWDGVQGYVAAHFVKGFR
jgi:hypothetical protein